jgi:hypothetical protein
LGGAAVLASRSPSFNGETQEDSIMLDRAAQCTPSKKDLWCCGKKFDRKAPAKVPRRVPRQIAFDKTLIKNGKKESAAELFRRAMPCARLESAR